MSERRYERTREREERMVQATSTVLSKIIAADALQSTSFMFGIINDEKFENSLLPKRVQ